MIPRKQSIATLGGLDWLCPYSALKNPQAGRRGTFNPFNPRESTSGPLSSLSGGLIYLAHGALWLSHSRAMNPSPLMHYGTKATPELLSP